MRVIWNVIELLTKLPPNDVYYPFKKDIHYYWIIEN